MLPTSKGRETAGRATGSPADPKLSPKLERAREKTLSALGRLSLSDALVQLKTVFENQKTEEGRLANLSAQTWILRRRLEALRKGQPGPDVQSFMQTNHLSWCVSNLHQPRPRSAQTQYISQRVSTRELDMSSSLVR